MRSRRGAVTGRLVWGFLALWVLAGCGGPAPEDGLAGDAPADAPTATTEGAVVLATSRLGPITVQDIDRYVGRAPYRPDPQQPLSERYRELARRLALESLLLGEVSQGGGVSGDASQGFDLQFQVYIYSQHHLSTLEPPAEITEEDLRRAFEERRDTSRREETRRVSHIFLRYPEGGDALSTWQRIESIRQQIVDGHPFQQMAREVSESETRHRDGLLGFVTRGTFPPDFDQVVFALEPEVPSAPVSTADGAHLFYVSNVLEASDPSFEELRELLTQALGLERQGEQLRAAAEAFPMPADAFGVEPQALRRLLRDADGDREILRLGEFRLTLGALREQLASAQRALGELADEGLAERLLAEWQDRARIYDAMRRREAAGESIDLPREGIAAQLRQQQVENRLQALVQAHVERDVEGLARHHAQHAMRFVTPLRLEIDRLAVPIDGLSGTDAAAAMARLEAARQALDSGQLSLAEVAVTLAGDVTRLGPLTLAELQRIDPAAVRFAALLRVGEHAPPYRDGDTLTLFSVVARSEPRPLPFDAVRQRVVDDILQQQGAALAREVSDAMLSEASFTIDEEALARLTVRP